MDKMHLWIFQSEVERQCDFALIAAQDLEGSLQSMGAVEKAEDPIAHMKYCMDRLWYSVQALLVAVGNISKLLWPSKELLPKRGAELRTSLSVGEDSPLEPRTFRNHFEHFDERLEQWATSSDRRNFFDSNVGPAGMKLVKGLDIEPGDYLRNFDTTNFAVTFRGDVYHLHPLIGAISDLCREANRVARQWGRPGNS